MPRTRRDLDQRFAARDEIGAVTVWTLLCLAYGQYRNYCGPGLADSICGSLWWAPPAALALLIFLHGRTGGRTSPTAAFFFVLIGPVLGVIILVPLAATERTRFEATGVVQPVATLDALTFIHTMACSAIAAAAVAAAIHAFLIYDEWAPTYTPLNTSGGAVSITPFFLSEFGLDRSSSLAELERAYMEKARGVHPDHGGDEADFKRLHDRYERARDYLTRRDRVRSTPTQAS